MLCVFNLGEAARAWRPTDAADWTPLLSAGDVAAWHFPAASALVAWG
jgi:alpha-glucosidase